jgi:hypothetical protein
VLNQKGPVPSPTRQDLQERECIDLLGKLGAIPYIREMRANRLPGSLQVNSRALAIDTRQILQSLLKSDYVRANARVCYPQAATGGREKNHIDDEVSLLGMLVQVRHAPAQNPSQLARYVADLLQWAASRFAARQDPP